MNTKYKVTGQVWAIPSFQSPLFFFLFVFFFCISAAKAQSLSSAAGGNDTAKVLSLISQGADVNKADENGSTPLMSAARWSCAPNVRILLAHGAIPDKVRSAKGRTALMVACAYYSGLDVVKLLVENGADVNSTSNDGTTSLMLAAQNGKVEVVTYLLSKGANASLKNNSGQTALDLAKSADLSIFGSNGLKGVKLDKEGTIKALTNAAE